MRKNKKLVSILCAVALLVSALPAAAAAEPLSEYAGKTVPVQAFDETENGWVSRIVEVAIPQGATETEANNLMYAAAFNQDGISAFSANETLYPLSTENDLEITATPQRVGGGSMPNGVQLDQTLIRVNIGWVNGSSYNVHLLFQVRDLGDPVANTEWNELDMNHLPWEVYIRYNSFPVTNQGISVYAKTSVDRHVFLNSCAVFGVVD